ncbi:hypothetical protein [Acidovorax sp. SUPP2825]|uniref:hypothetical protein n=1 Tax=Acidovorax sp. SUPP2825 TaxID=2920879 RepID=UPI0023DE1AA9|nr:hypothetical protein [Acidovorax sp. SUPP2825]GKS97438.1 hypothetical protein AVAK2825_22905 [Acidovorax sp. SUPP2825]
MQTIELGLYEALTDIGVDPDAARNAERALEAALRASREAMRTEMRQHLSAGADDQRTHETIRHELGEIQCNLLRAMDDHVRWGSISLVIVNAFIAVLTVAAIKLL